jgi:hypothetical protein
MDVVIGVAVERSTLRLAVLPSPPDGMPLQQREMNCPTVHDVVATLAGEQAELARSGRRVVATGVVGGLASALGGASTGVVTVGPLDAAVAVVRGPARAAGYERVGVLVVADQQARLLMLRPQSGAFDVVSVREMPDDELMSACANVAHDLGGAAALFVIGSDAVAGALRSVVPAAVSVAAVPDASFAVARGAALCASDAVAAAPPTMAAAPFGAPTMAAPTAGDVTTANPTAAPSAVGPQDLTVMQPPLAYSQVLDEPVAAAPPRTDPWAPAGSPQPVREAADPFGPPPPGDPFTPVHHHPPPAWPTPAPRDRVATLRLASAISGVVLLVIAVLALLAALHVIPLP